MACSECRHRAALIAGFAPAIEELALSRQSLLGLLAMTDSQLRRFAGTAAAPAPGRRSPDDASRTPRAVCGAELCRHDPDYPRTLAQLDCAPAVLHASCEPARLRALLAAPSVAIVGDRTHTHYAQQVAFTLAHDLARAGVTVVSGVNQGLEGTAHHGALHAGGQTIAVAGCAPEIPYPRQLEHLHRRILAHGAVVSELPRGFHPPRRWTLIASQRIIAALARVLVIVEAGERSSALFACEIASDLGGEVAVVPGRVTDAGGLGTFGLLRDGAHPVACARDVLELIR
jgi:DNA processing protein